MRPAPRSRWISVTGWALAILVASVSSAAASGTVRYGLVIGVDRGLPSRGLPRLKHAESDAAELHQRLIEYGRFDPQGTHLLQAPSRAEVLAAARDVADRIAADRARYGPAQVIFGLFYSGHGLPGEILVEDGALRSAELSALFEGADADLLIGFFDTCRAGSLASGMPIPGRKGVTVQPGFNPLEALPEPTSRTTGAILFMSSSSDELSYEDPELGGLFTHYFTEAFIEASPGSGAVSLDAMWRYTSSRVRAHAGELTQTPRRHAWVEQDGVLFFGFRPRNARLRVLPGVPTDLVLRYPDVDLIERIRPDASRITDVPTYSGKLELVRLGDGGRTHARVALEVAPDQIVEVHPADFEISVPEPGYSRRTLRSKGFGVTATEASWQLGVGVEYGQTHVPMQAMGLSRTLGLHTRLVRGPLSLSVVVAGGTHAQRFANDGGGTTETAGLDGRLEVGVGHGWRSLRLEGLTLGGGRALWHTTTPNKGESLAATIGEFYLGVGGRASVGVSGFDALRIEFTGQALFGPSSHVYADAVGQDREPVWSTTGRFTAGLTWHFFD